MGFFDDLGEKITQTGQGAMKKTKELADISKLNSQISQEERAINNQYLQLGKAFYENNTECPDDTYLQFFSTVTQKKALVEDLKNQVLAIKARKNCPNCGATIDENAMFCAKCGSRVEVVQQPEAVQQLEAVQQPETVQNVEVVEQTETVEQEEVQQPEVDVNQNVAPTEENVEPSYKFCPQCGKKEITGVAFCSNCGSAL